MNIKRQERISAAVIVALLFLAWGIGIAGLMAENASTTTRYREEKHAQPYPVNENAVQSINIVDSVTS